jgi:hypothetical protein
MAGRHSAFQQSHTMHNRLTSRKRPASSPKQGNTVPAQGETQEKVPRMPHERDESADSQAPQEPSGKRMGQQAHDDMERGLVDTDKGPALDATYDKVREGAADPVKKFLP